VWQSNVKSSKSLIIVVISNTDLYRNCMFCILFIFINFTIVYSGKLFLMIGIYLNLFALLLFFDLNFSAKPPQKVL